MNESVKLFLLLSWFIAWPYVLAVILLISLLLTGFSYIKNQLVGLVPIVWLMNAIVAGAMLHNIHNTFSGGTSLFPSLVWVFAGSILMFCITIMRFARRLFATESS